MPQFYGKSAPRQSVVDHGLMVGGCLSALTTMDNVPFDPSIGRLGIAHDIGKLSQPFQVHKIGVKNKTDYTIPQGNHVHHVTVGCSILSAIKQHTEWLNEMPTTGLKTVLGHHGSPASIVGDEWIRSAITESINNKTTTNVLNKKQVSQIQSIFDWLSEFSIESIDSSNTWILNGLVTIADWIASRDKIRSVMMEPEQNWKDRLKTYYHQFKEHTGLQSLLNRSWTASSFEDVYPEWTPHDLQDYVDSMTIPDDPSLFILEDTTGSGKTEAALTLSCRLIDQNRASGAFFALPTRATSNALYDRFLSKPDGDHKHSVIDRIGVNQVVLAHGLTGDMRSLGMVQQTNDDTPWFQDRLKTALFATFGVGTVDQALKSALPVFHNTLRMLALNRSVLVVDEVHDFDPYVNTLLKRVLDQRGELGLDTILLTATLSDRQRNEFCDRYKSADKSEQAGVELL